MARDLLRGGIAAAPRPSLWRGVRALKAPEPSKSAKTSIEPWYRASQLPTSYDDFGLSQGFTNREIVSAAGVVETCDSPRVLPPASSLIAGTRARS
eukprot:31497-Pelagococcus_subviridis.AAC.63